MYTNVSGMGNKHDELEAVAKGPHECLINKFEKCGLDKITVKWIDNWFNSCKQRLIISGSMSGWQEVSSHRGLSWGQCC